MELGFFAVSTLSEQGFAWLDTVEDPLHIFDPLLRLLIQKEAPLTDNVLQASSQALQRLGLSQKAGFALVLVLDERGDFADLTLLPIEESKLSRVQERLALDDLGPIEGVIGRSQSRIWKDEEEAPLLCSRASLKSGMGTPLLKEKQARGALALLEGTNGDFAPSQLLALERLASLVSELIRWSRHPENRPRASDCAYFLARLTRCQSFDIQKSDIDEELLNRVDTDFLIRSLILPLSLDGSEVTVALANPLDFDNLQNFELMTGWVVVTKYVASAEDILSVFTQPDVTYSQAEIKESILSELNLESPDLKSESRLVNENSAPIIRLANWLILEADKASASDIHVEPEESELVIRFRIDGVCHVFERLPKSVHLPIVNRIKIMADMNIAERRLPQDGRLNFIKFQSKHEVDLRVSIVPTVLGESVVMRVLQKNNSMIPLDKLGFSKEILDRYLGMIAAPHGMILHCGPTGSGKSMSMFAALQTLNSPEVKIVTAENPVEYTLPGLTQVEVNPQVGLTFSKALRAFLRQDPDIILIGEMRDHETAEIGVQAALTGHKLFSTLHTNDACSSIVRLNELKIDPFLIADATLGICAQRLLRRLCTCKTVTAPSLEENFFLERMTGEAYETIAIAQGCERCKNSGYKGRIGIYELLTMNSPLRETINKGHLGDQLKRVARKHGMKTLFEEGLRRVKDYTVCLNTVKKQLPHDEN